MLGPFTLLGLLLLLSTVSSFSSWSSFSLFPGDVKAEVHHFDQKQKVHHLPQFLGEEEKPWQDMSRRPRKHIREIKYKENLEDVFYFMDVDSKSEEDVYARQRQKREHEVNPMTLTKLHTISMDRHHSVGDRNSNTKTEISRQDGGHKVRAGQDTPQYSDELMEDMYGTSQIGKDNITAEDFEKLTCKEGEWLCNDTMQCIPQEQLCNGTTNCSNKSEEADEICGCKDGWFKCKTKCIPKSKLCDNYLHCPDGEDETNETCGGMTNYCEHKYKDYFRCDYGGCIRNIYHCDFKKDCLDGSDENNCSHPQCPKSYFQCANKQCVPAGKLCDQHDDCVDKSDENTTLCAPQNFKQCKTGEQIHKLFWCDGHINCPYDHADESHCIPVCERGTSVGCNMHKWHMDKYRCLDKKYICDETNFCGMKTSDYEMCLNYTTNSCEIFEKQSSQELFLCHDEPYGRCIVKERVCNGKHDCLNGEDENDTRCSKYFPECKAGEFRCEGGPCVNESARCNLSYECKDLSDEMNCDNHTCGPNMKSCRTGQCVRQEYWCDHVQDCPDGSDEDEELCHEKFEKECSDPEGVFECLGPKRQCIPKREVCVVLPARRGCADKSHLYQDCKSRVNCTSLGMEQCRKGQCYSREQKCDGEPECPGTYDDEDLCAYDCSQEEANCFCYDSVGNCSGRNLQEFPFIVYTIMNLDLSYNSLGLDIDNVGRYENLLHLNLTDNNITELHPWAFSHLKKLISLDLRNNKLTRLTGEAFIGLDRLEILHLEGNELHTISHRAFLGLVSLQQLNLSHQRISVIEPEAFLGLDNLVTLLLSHNELDVQRQDVFTGMPNLHKLETDKWSYCCLVPNVTDCSPQREAFSSCDDLMSNHVLRVFIWVVGSVALLGNAFTIYCHVSYSLTQKVNSILLRNLAMGDLLMGVYLLLVAGVDQHYRGLYSIHEESWRKSHLCRLAGFLSTLSSEVTVFTLTIMTMERQYTIRKCMNCRISRCLTLLENGGPVRLLMLAVWAVAILLAALPLSNLQYFSNFYGRSGVCLALHVTKERASGWEYSVFVFLVLNLVSFGIIAMNYFLLYKQVRNHNTNVRNENRDSRWNEMKLLGLRVFLLVFTDALCWIPIIFLGILSISGVDIPPSVFSWLAVFVLPINSAVNPILYTFTSNQFKNQVNYLRGSMYSRRRTTSYSTGFTHQTSLSVGVTKSTRPATRSENRSSTSRTMITTYNENSSPPVTNYIQRPSVLQREHMKNVRNLDGEEENSL